MHEYMRAIGLTDDRLTEYDVGRLCDSVYEKFDRMETVRDDEKKVNFLELTRDFGKGFGLKVLGRQDRSGFHRTSYYPYVMGTDSGSEGSVGIQKKTNGDSYIGVCNDGRVGAPLIFTLQNPGVYLRGLKEDPGHQYRVTTTFSALSLSGRILLPTRSRARQLSWEPSEWEEERINTIELAKMGDSKAIQNVTLQNLELYSMVQQRIADGEDILSIVDTYFIPYGMESDQYHILANIRRVIPARSTVTGELVYRMQLNIDGLYMDMCIRGADLEGYPTAGMRFRGDVWIQGRLNFKLPSPDPK